MEESERVELLKKLKTGARYVYLRAKVSMYGGTIIKAYVGVYAGMDEDGNVIFTDVEFCYPTFSKNVYYPSDGYIATIPVERMLGDGAFLPTYPNTEELIEVNPTEDLLNEMCFQ